MIYLEKLTNHLASQEILCLELKCQLPYSQKPANYDCIIFLPVGHANHTILLSIFKTPNKAGQFKSLCIERGINVPFETGEMCIWRLGDCN